MTFSSSAIQPSLGLLDHDRTYRYFFTFKQYQGLTISLLLGPFLFVGLFVFILLQNKKKAEGEVRQRSYPTHGPFPFPLVLQAICVPRWSLYQVLPLAFEEVSECFPKQLHQFTFLPQ